MKCIFITGAASGMGHATAVLFASKGWFVGAYDISVEFERLGIRAADVLPGLIDTPILESTPKRSTDMPAKRAEPPKRGMFRLMPPESVAACVWKACHSKRLHWYVPGAIAWIDRLTGLSPCLVRNFMRSFLNKAMEDARKRMGP